VLFEDIMPIFADASVHESLIRALEIHCLRAYTAENRAPDVVVGLDARGFLFGPSLALRLGAGFVPVRKKGKLPGPTVTAGYAKEYGEDLFQIQVGSIKKGQRVLIVDDIIATGMCVWMHWAHT
jgi:adenine phosphoribosyltransferase